MLGITDGRLKGNTKYNTKILQNDVGQIFVFRNLSFKTLKILFENSQTFLLEEANTTDNLRIKTLPDKDVLSDCLSTARRLLRTP